MKKRSTPKLTLSKETLRELTSTESFVVQGGNEIDTVVNSCPSVCPCG
jgi:hypothetical protein